MSKISQKVYDFQRKTYLFLLKEIQIKAVEAFLRFET